MTSINAIRFDHYSGAMVCDEQRGWNPENMIINSADKIKSVVPPDIMEATGLSAAYGNTGTSTIGDELKFNIKKRIRKEFDAQVEKTGKAPASVATIQKLAQWAFEAQTELKRTHINQTIQGRYGFSVNDFCRGFYKVDGKQIDIKDKEVITSIHDAITWKGRTGEMTSIFLNAGIIAGYEPESGFRIYTLSMIEHAYWPVQEIFLTDGSGRDMASVEMTNFSNRKTVPERRGAIHPVEGLFEMIHAVNTACRHDIGCEGYLNIMLFNGKKTNSERLIQINDDRAKLASEIVRCHDGRFIEKMKALELIDGLLYGGATWVEIEDRFWTASARPDDMFDYLRNYPDTPMPR
ncbi:hypothetical protein JXA80_09660 [bacterium]|nr:hypothetical protein [candidate division CSSED10-310 bacterium]